MTTERDYVLGTHDEEIARLGLQHRVWRPVVLNCWERAGITVGKRVLDVGAGPGYAAMDLAEIVGMNGEVVAVERSNKFVRAMEQMRTARSFNNLTIRELDLMLDDLPGGPFDYSWSRWVLCFLNDPVVAVRKIAGALKRGGIAIFHEYGAYDTWRFVPPRPAMEEFRKHVIESWRATGGEPDVGVVLPSLLTETGFAVRWARPHIFCIKPTDYMWQWPAAFIESYPSRLQELLNLDAGFNERLHSELAEAERAPNSLMLTPLVLEIVAEKIA